MNQRCGICRQIKSQANWALINSVRLQVNETIQRLDFWRFWS
jgi:hypothetical protein